MNKFNEILKLLNIKTVNYNFFSFNNKIILSKDENYNNFKVIFSRKFIKFNDRNNVTEMSNVIKNFIIVMNNNCKNFNLNKFLENFAKTYFDINKIGKNNVCEGNLIITPKKVIYEINDFSVSYHELFHLASLNKKFQTGGFSNFSNFGVGIDEGFTQYMAEKHFNENVGKAYHLLIIIVEFLEKIIGKDELEKIYFNSPIAINRLIDELCEYEKYENVLNFIRNTDKLTNYNLYYITKEEIEQIKIFSDDICNFLFSCLKNKINIIIEDENILNKFELIENLILGIAPKSININDDVIELFSIEKINQLFNYTSNNIRKK